ncbi:putative DNA-binding protein with PD1-like motif [Massilia sp. UYP11]|uniref:PPC domain-containing DNA-binding protein n=1 Tax=Massilia sp. UYP11 TaxID=1756385 RepID=UPI003D235027
MQLLPIRLRPRQDLREALAAILSEHGVGAAFVLSGIGSLSEARIRYAGAGEAGLLRGDLEILTLSGSIAPDGVHLHMTVSDAQGKVIGGHVAPGCTVRTTAEILLALLPDYRFSRAPDPQSGWDELVVRRL